MGITIVTNPASLGAQRNLNNTSQRLSDNIQRLSSGLRINRAADDAAVILGADTVVAVGRRILPKAETETEARHCLNLLSGRRHKVLGGLCLIDAAGGEHLRLVTTAVVFKRLSIREIDGYIGAGEWRGKAGGYAIQGRAAALVKQIVGSYSNVVGLPLFETAALLKGMGIHD